MTAIADAALHVFGDRDALALGFAEWLTARAEAKPDKFVVALSGGSTPKPVYQALARPPLRDRFPWDKAHFVIGDERFVAYGDPASNYGMICDALLTHVALPPGHAHPVPTEMVTIEQAVAQYEATLKTLYGADAFDPARPLLDVDILGLGNDGHTASLIPGQPVLRERARWVAAVTHGRTEPRVTLTYPTLESAAATAFLVAGEGKRAIVESILSGTADVPAAHLRPVGEVHFFLDREAAGSRA